jgi:hypothetical protein
MKLSRKVWLILGAVILVAALVSLYMVYSGQAAERNDLNARLDRAETLLPTLTSNKQELENQLAQAQSSLNTSQAQFPQVLESIKYNDDLFEIADDCNVDITRLTASPPTSKAVGAVTYSVSSFVMTVSGSIDNILKFIDAIGTGIDYDLTWNFQLPWSVDVKSVNMDVAGATATINLDIYGYKG